MVNFNQLFLLTEKTPWGPVDEYKANDWNISDATKLHPDYKNRLEAANALKKNNTVFDRSLRSPVPRMQLGPFEVDPEPVRKPTPPPPLNADPIPPPIGTVVASRVFVPLPTPIFYVAPIPTFILAPAPPGFVKAVNKQRAQTMYGSTAGIRKPSQTSSIKTPPTTPASTQKPTASAPIRTPAAIVVPNEANSPEVYDAEFPPLG
uniref:Uncharacterized protein n=1 Tax=Panagrolaimus sp. JU765 TaxID=591449 RepID=A0AC34QTR9_9BILA